jgi:hypothetical protein
MIYFLPDSPLALIALRSQPWGRHNNAGRKVVRGQQPSRIPFRTAQLVADRKRSPTLGYMDAIAVGAAREVTKNTIKNSTVWWDN